MKDLKWYQVLLITALLISLHPTTGCVNDNAGNKTTAPGTTNTAPVTHDRQIRTQEGIPINIKLTALDDDDEILFYIDTVPAHGTLVRVDNEKYTYSPHEFFSGVDSFTFYAGDGAHQSNTATVTIYVDFVGDPPVAYSQSVFVNENTACVPTEAVFTLEAMDPDADAITYELVTLPSNGDLARTTPSGPECIYVPAQDYYGPDSFTYKVNDGHNDSEAVTVQIEVREVNFAPVAAEHSGPLRTLEDVPIESIILMADDPDGDVLTYIIDRAPEHGTLEQVDTDEFRYIPYPDYNGSDSFAFSVFDGRERSNTIEVSIEVDPDDDTPRAKDIFSSTNTNTQCTITLIGYDPDGDEVGYTLETVPSHGILTPDPLHEDRYTYEPDPAYRGTDSFTYTVNDGIESSVAATISIEVTPEGVLFVREDAPEDGNGLSWNRAFPHPQDAVNAAAPGTEIWIARGRYTKKRETDTVLVILQDEINLYGGFSGTEYEREERAPDKNESIFDGEHSVHHVLYSARDVLIDGITITHGGLAGNGEHDNNGAGIYISHENVSIQNSVFRDNNAPAHGSGVFIAQSANALFSECNFTGNRAGSDGGALYVSESAPAELFSCYFENNSAGSDGGAVYGYFDSSITVHESVFTGNRAQDYSGGMCMYGTAEISDSKFNSTAGANTAGYGGCMAAAFGQTSVTDTEFTGCTASNAGGAVYISNAVFTLTRVQFRDNHSSYGGALYGEEYHSEIVATQFVGNNSDNNGGAVYLFHNAQPVFKGCSFTSNYALNNGGALAAADESIPSCTDTVFIQNTASADGGAVHLASHSHASFRSCIWNNNISYGNGGALFSRQSNPIIKECAFRENTAHNGGAVASGFYSEGTISDTIFELNASDTEDGGALFFTGYARTRVERCSLTANIASGNGGAIAVIDNASPSISETHIKDNNASNNVLNPGKGGGIFVDGDSSPTFASCTIANNLAFTGNGLYISQSNPCILNCLIHNNNESGIHIENSAPLIANCTIVEHNGPGIFISEDSVPVVINSIIRGNVTIEDEVKYYHNIVNKNTELPCDSDSCFITYSCIEETPGSIFYAMAGGNINTDPLFLHDSSTGRQYLLQTGSPCVNKGDPDTEQFILDIISSKTTGSDQEPDMDRADIGYHYPPR